MGVQTKKKPAPKPSPEPIALDVQREQALLAEIHDLRARLEEYISGRVLELKAGQDGQGLPLGVLRASLVGNETCVCRCAAKLLGDPLA